MTNPSRTFFWDILHTRSHTRSHTHTQGWKHKLRPTSLAEEVNNITILVWWNKIIFVVSLLRFEPRPSENQLQYTFVFYSRMLGTYNPQMQYRPTAVPLLNFNQNQYPNQFQNRVPVGSPPRFQQHHYQQTTQSNSVHGDSNRLQPVSEWPSLSDAKFKGSPAQNETPQGSRDVKRPDVFWSKLNEEQDEEKKQLCK